MTGVITRRVGHQPDADFGRPCERRAAGPRTFNPAQRDRAGLGTSLPDGTGDLCQNFEFDADGEVAASDVTLARRRLAGLEPGLDPAQPPTNGCADGVASQGFAPDMFGCAGSVIWVNRTTLCAPGWSVCSAAQWVARRDGAAPTHSYWTEDALRWSGIVSSCWVHETVGNTCTPADASMRVCAATTDPLGNTCNWVGCGYQSAPPPSEFFGGCSGNFTAGTLCCQ